jgi:EAL domain-containing protein (putative c-di-GMP-specific phosphodiesterase class I)
VLGVDDEPLVLRSYERLFARAGAEFVPAQSVGEALTHLAAQPFDVVLTDIHMPGKSGLDLLREIRERGFDVPAILITGSPHVDTAVQAIEHGAVRYLSKPVDYHELVRVVGEVAGIYKLHRLRHAAHDHVRSWEEQAQQAELEQLFSRCLDRLWIAYQPIISLSERRVVAYEALCRSDETAMATPVTIIGAAEKLGRVHELSRRIRERALEKLPAMPSDCSLFLNLHPEDLDDSDLIDPFTATADCAERIVLEVTERRQLDDVVHLKERIAALKSLGYRIAVDDLGAGYAGLSSLAHLDPAVVKLDMSLVRGVDSQPIKQRLIRSMAELCADMGAAVIVEGVETPGERDALVDCRCDWMQGYLFGRPARELGEPRF